MDTKVCQHCGTELSNKRAKNCPACSEILADANKRGVYGAVMSAIAEAKSESVTGMDMHEVMRAAMVTGQSARNEVLARIRQANADRKARLAERTRYYAEHGRWPGSGAIDEEDAERIEAEAIRNETRLTTPAEDHPYAD